MDLSLEKDDLKSYIIKQVNNFFPDKYEIKSLDVEKVLNNALYRTEYCFSHIPLKYYLEDGVVKFNHLNSEQYCMFLWFLSNESYLNNNINLAEKLFYLNKALNGVDAFYSVKLPEIFMLVHPVGTVIGNAHYENYLLIHQNCTIGSSKEGIYPVFAENTALCAGSMVLGKCEIGKNVTFSAGTYVVNKNIPENKIVFGEGKNIVLKEQNNLLIELTFKKD